LLNLDNAFSRIKMKRLHSNYTILPEVRLILECCKGETTVEEAVEMKQAELTDPLYDPKYNIIVDFQEFETSLNSKTAESVLNFVKFIQMLKINSKVALLTTTPQQVVVSELLKRLSNDFLEISVETFSTLETAIKFVNSSIDQIDFVDDKLIELRRNTL
jgi:hypothetical protein